jgi:flagellar hook-associated protein 1 FlgK
MTTALINIGRTGAAAARTALELTAQNIANAGNADYSRRTLGQTEVVVGATIGFVSAESLGGVLTGSIQRAGDNLLQLQARNGSSDLARADAELRGLRGAETALEQSQLYETLIAYEAALTRLESDPLDSTLRTLALETARQLSDTFQLADRTLGSARAQVQAEVTVGVEQVNNLTLELTRINADLVSAQDGSARHAALLDQRDAALRQLADEFAINVTYDDIGAASVRIKGDPETRLVLGTGRNTLTSALTGNGSVTFNIGSLQFQPEGGAMAGRQAALTAQGTAQANLDAVAATVIASGNALQAGGVAPDGTAGQPLFSGSSARTIGLALTNGNQLATAPAGAPAGSRDTTALSTLLASLDAADGPTDATDALLTGLSSRISGLVTRREGLAIIADTARAQLLSATGVDLDAEATNLVRLQQAFEANARVIQVAGELFDTILGLQ